MPLRQEITDFITESAASQENSILFRAPLVGFADTADPLFVQLKNIVGDYHLLPSDILPSAQTAVAFFLPFSADVIKSNRSQEVSRQWAAAYIAANAAINAICAELIDMLTAKGIEAATVAATHNYDAETLTSPWSHRSVACIAGLGRFGLNRMLITPVGCAGRYGSVLLSEKLSADARPDEGKEKEPCTWFREGSCRFCIDNCPTQALTEEGIDRHLCNDHLLEISKNFTDIGFCDVCGKCAIGSCALRG